MRRILHVAAWCLVLGVLFASFVEGARGGPVIIGTESIGFAEPDICFDQGTGEDTVPGGSAFDLYTATGPNAIGVDCTDGGTGTLLALFTLAATSDALGTNTAGASRVAYLEGSTCSTTDNCGAGGTIGGITSVEPVNDQSILQSHFRTSLPAGAISEFGMQWFNQSITLSMHGASVIAWPESSMGTEDSTWFDLQPTADFGGSSIDIGLNCNTGTVCNAASAASVSGLDSGEFLVLWQIQLGAGNGALSDLGAGNGRTLQVRVEQDGVDPHSVVGEGSVVRGEVGYQMRFGQHNFPVHMFGGFYVDTLTSGTHTWDFAMTKSESGDGDEAAVIPWVLGLKTSQFANFGWMSHSSRVDLTSASFTDSPFEVAEFGVGGAPVVVGVHTTVHINTLATMGTAFRLVRDGSTVLTPTGTATAGSVPIAAPNGEWDAAPDMSTGADPDNNTLPVTIYWVDDPGPGTYTYTFQSQRLGTGVGPGTVYWNTQTDGTGGFTGYMFVAEMSLRN